MVADFNAGSIEGTLDVNLEPFEMGLAKARAEAAAFEGSDYTATLHVRNDGDMPVLDEVGDRTSTTNFKADTSDFDRGAARVEAEAEVLDGKDVEVDVKADTSIAAANISGLMALIFGLGPALIPLGAAAAATLPALATGAGAAVAAIAPLALGIMDVAGAMKLLESEEKAEQAAAQANAQQAKISAEAQANAALQVQSATDALANARRQADSQAISSAEQVKHARQSLADAEANAAQRELAANDAVIAAQYQREQAINDELDAQQRLNDARDTAARQLEDAANRAVDSQLALEQSQLDLTDAQDAYNAAQADHTTTARELQQLELNLARAQQRVTEATQEASRAQQDNNEAQTAGVDGNPGVLAAQDALEQAQHNVEEATKASTQAELDRQQTYVDSAKSIAAAQEQVADAVRASADSQAASAYSIVTAQRALDAAYAASAKAAQSSQSSADAALQKIRDDIADTNPVVLEFANFVNDELKPAFKDMQDAAAEGMLPGVQEALENIMPLMDGFNGFLRDMGGVIGDIAVDMSEALNDPFWQDFFGWFGGEATDAVAGMANALGDIVTGIAGMMEAFAPVTEAIGGGVLDLTEKFKDWATQTDPDSSIMRFVEWLKENGPEIAETMGKFATAIGHVVEALAPVGMLALDVFEHFLDAFNHVPLPVLTALGIALGIIVPLLWTLSKMVALAELIGSIGIAFGIAGEGATAAAVGMDLLLGPVGLIIAAIALLALGIYELIEHWDAVKGAMEAVGGFISDVFTAVWDALKDAIGFVSDHIEYFMLLLGPLGVAIDIVIEVFEHWGDIVDFVKGLFEDFIDFVEAIPGEIVDAFEDAYDWLKDAGTNIVNGLWDAFNAVWDRFWDFFSGLPGDITGIFSDAYHWLFNAGKDIVNGLWDGIKEVWDDLTGWIGDAASHLPGFLKGPLGIDSPSKVMMQLGRYTSEGFFIGFRDHWENTMSPYIRDAMYELTDNTEAFGGDINIANRHAQVHMANEAMYGVRDALDGVQQSTGELPGQLGEKFDEMTNRLAAAIGDLHEKYADTVTEAFEKSQTKSTQQIITAVRAG